MATVCEVRELPVTESLVITRVAAVPALSTAEPGSLI